MPLKAAGRQCDAWCIVPARAHPAWQPTAQLCCRGLFYVNYELQGKLGEGAFGEARIARRRKVSVCPPTCRSDVPQHLEVYPDAETLW